MDSVIVFFGQAQFEEVESEAARFGFVHGVVCRADTRFYLRRYSEQEQSTELSDSERQAIAARLGSPPSSAFVVEARHGPDARFALEVIARLMDSLRPAVLDDDFGGLWSPDDVAGRFRSSAGNGIYVLRNNNG